MNSLKLIDLSQYRTIIFICKYHMAGRAYLTLKKFAGEAKLVQDALAANDFLGIVGLKMKKLKIKFGRHFYA